MRLNRQTKYGYLLKNIGLLSISQFATKILAFFLVPLYTNILSTTEYGIYDLITTSVAIMLPICTINIQEAVVLFLIDKGNCRNVVATIGVKYVLLSNVIVLILLNINSYFRFSETIADYSLLFFLLFCVQSWNGILTAFVRGIDKIKALSISGVVASTIMILCNVIFLVVLKWGILGFFLANIIGAFSQSIYLIFCTRLFSYYQFEEFPIEERAMIKYSGPLIINSIAWWINNVSDRYVVIYFCGLAENGIYSVAGKIPSMMNILQSIVNQAWTLSAVKDFDPDDSKDFFSNTYRAYNCLLVILCSGIITFNKIFAKVMYAKDFFSAWRYVPWLTIAIVFGAISGYLGGLFAAVKNSKAFAKSTIIGAIINVGLNFSFTPTYGAIGAAVATTISYFVVWIFRFLHVKKFINIRINIKRDAFSYAILVVQALVMNCINGLKLYFIEGGLLFIIVVLYCGEFKKLTNKIVEKKNDVSAKNL